MIEETDAAPRSRGRASDAARGVDDGSPTLLLSRSTMLRNAYDFATRAHTGQRQESDDSPYIEHPVAVARLLQHAGLGDEVVAAGLLHDTVEGAGVRIEDLTRGFGRRVADLVSAMTEPGRLPDFRLRKAAHRAQIARAGREAAAIFAADKIANAQNLRRAVAEQGESGVRRRLSKPLEQKVEHHRMTLEMLEDLALSLSLVPMLREELASLDEVRSRDARVAS